MSTPLLYTSSNMDISPSTTNCPVTVAARHSKDTTDHQQHQHQNIVPEVSSISFIPELLLSSLLQSQYNLSQSPIIIQPIHHTLENATITYDTLVEQQKELVKDVFFSPAMNPSSTTATDTSLLSTSLSSTSSTTSAFNSDDDTNTSCGSQTDCESTRSLEDDFNPSDLLLDQDDASLFFGQLDLDLERQKAMEKSSPGSPSSSCSASLSNTNSSAMKRKRNDDLLPQNKKRDLWLNVISPKSTPPMSPNELSWDYFDASGEDSSDDDVASSSLDYQTMNADFQSISVQDDQSDSDDDSISSWENRRANMFDDASDKEDKITTTRNSNKVLRKKKQQLNSTTTTKKQKQPRKVKTLSTNNIPAPSESHDHLEKVDPRPTCHPTIYQKLTKTNVDWCRYCGTTEGVNWRPGPWGKRTLCNKHGCDYKGYGFACKLPRLDLTGYAHESLHDRDRPVLQFYCASCHRMESWVTNILVRCEGCYKSYHQKCYHGQEQELSDRFVSSDQPWYCDATCRENVARRRIVVEISRKRLPLMCAPTKNQVQASLCNNKDLMLNNNNNNNNHATSSLVGRTTRGGAGGRDATK